MEASRLVTVESTASRISRLLRKSHFLPNRSPLQQWFETLLEGAKERSEKQKSRGKKENCIDWKTDEKILQKEFKYSRIQDQDVTDTEWFFFLSIAHDFVNSSGLLGQAFFNSNPVWATRPNLLSEPACQRARRLHEFGLQTMVCISCPNGVVELASIDVVLPNPDLMIKVRDLIIFNGPLSDLTSAEIIQPRFWYSHVVRIW
ncbi:transcription factor MYC2 [Vigna unguiculata]|uniref:Transcription factor n=1 Tax=Vigna unguiculata TaxID=3917 RepID=A0A4D6MDF9_VIGUN|nr:transcription factor MYC2 [Vigna unguiculata]